MGYEAKKVAVDDPRIDDTEPLTEEQIGKLKHGSDWFAERGLTPPKPRGRPPAENPKVPVKIRLDADLVERLKADGPGWQTRANEMLRKATGI